MGREEKGRSSREYDAGELFRVKEFDRRLLERLASLALDFKKARKKIGVDDSVGFGSLPLCHDSESVGMLTKAGRSDIAVLTYEVRITSGFDQSQLFDNEKNKVIVFPNLTKQNPFLLSVYHSDAWWEPVRDFLTVNDDVYKGIIAHELAHWRLVFGQKLPKKVEKIIRMQENANISPGDFRKTPEYETQVDLVAGMFGYGKEIVASLDYLTARFNEIVASPSVGGEKRHDYILAIEDFENKKALVLKYCT